MESMVSWYRMIPCKKIQAISTRSHRLCKTNFHRKPQVKDLMHGRCADSTSGLLHSITGPMDRDEVKFPLKPVTQVAPWDLEIDASGALVTYPWYSIYCRQQQPADVGAAPLLMSGMSGKLSRIWRHCCETLTVSSSQSLSYVHRNSWSRCKLEASVWSSDSIRNFRCTAAEVLCHALVVPKMSALELFEGPCDLTAAASSKRQIWLLSPPFSNFTKECHSAN